MASLSGGSGVPLSEKGVMRVKLPAQGGAGGAGSDESSASVLSQTAQAKSRGLRAEGGLGPLVLVRVEAGELLKAGADGSVKGPHSIAVVAGGHNPRGEDHFSEAGAAAKQPESDLGVRQLAQSR